MYVCVFAIARKLEPFDSDRSVQHLWREIKTKATVGRRTLVRQWKCHPQEQYDQQQQQLIVAFFSPSLCVALCAVHNKLFPCRSTKPVLVARSRQQKDKKGIFKGGPIRGLGPDRVRKRVRIALRLGCWGTEEHGESECS